MDSKQIAIRESALAVKIAQAEGKRRGILDPLFNLREVAKQMLLLEDHLGHPYKICPDCVRKHLLTIEALAEEATTLSGNPTNKALQKLTEALAEKARKWMEALTDGAGVSGIAQEVRSVRKKLVPKVFDPRETPARIASVYLNRKILCPHRM
jgi:hypothetical protein